MKYKNLIVLGLDPGYSRIGYGVLKKQNGKIIYLTSGVFSFPPSPHLGKKLLALEKKLKKIIIAYHPLVVGVEKLFYFQNKKTIIGVAEARGIILKTLAEHKLQVVEMTPQHIKNSLTGDGKASKEGVAKMVKSFLNLNQRKMLDDETDALAIAISTFNQVLTL
jgi:crossover junction endodeoxyribonuclease RuvC